MVFGDMGFSHIYEMLEMQFLLQFDSSHELCLAEAQDRLLH